ncbi:hypothetical protein BBJ28_00024948 [Nothophytophthora sp. Chile5]|nr:hypothetical protein BBJ28_00024948 [Nothophytophthora sp. Chile5]
MLVYFNRGDMQSSIDTTQRCYTISHCWNNIKDVEWIDGPNPSQLVLFMFDHCQGTPKVLPGPRGEHKLKGEPLCKKVSSFMVREYSVFPLNGFVDYCHENAVLNSTSTSASGSEGVGVGEEAASFSRYTSLAD